MQISRLFKTKTPPAPVLLKQAAKLKSGSGEPNRNKVGTVTWSQCKQIAEEKMEDLNAFDVEAAAEMIAGTAVVWVLELIATSKGVVIMAKRGKKYQQAASLVNL